MKKIFILLAITAAVFSYSSAYSQACTPDASDTTLGFTPSPGIINPGIAANVCTQIYLPASVSGVALDSLILDSISGLPTNISYTINPASGIVFGGGHGVISFTGTTTDTIGDYYLTFYGNAYAGSGVNADTFVLDSPSVQALFNFYLRVQAPLIASCDTLSGVPANAFLNRYYPYPDTIGVGYLSGNGAVNPGSVAFYPSTDIAAELNAGAGDSISIAGVVFEKHTVVNAGDSANTVKLYIYDNTGPLGSPGNALDSGTITLAQAALSASTGNFAGVAFTNPAILTTDSFFVVLALPNTTGDTLVVQTDTVGEGGNGWVDYATLGWVAYSAHVGGSLGNYMGAIVCGTAFIPVAAFSEATTGACAPSTVYFTDRSTNNPESWSWYFGDSSAVSTVQSPTHTFDSAGTFYVTETVTNPTGVSTYTDSVFVYATPTLKDSTHNASTATSADGSAVVTPAGTGPFTYKWSEPLTETSGSLTGVVAGTYYVTVTGAHGCEAVDTVVISHGTGINTLSENVQIKIYPNPANDALNFVWNTNDNGEVAIYDVTGNPVRVFEVNGTTVNRFNIADIASGTYVIRVTDKQNNGQRSTLFSKF